jgi:hypothetical protein
MTQIQVQIHESPEDNTISFYVPSGTLLHINGIPAYTIGDALVRTHPQNVPLMFPQAEALADSSEQEA